MVVNVEAFHNWYKQQDFAHPVAVYWVGNIGGLIEAEIEKALENPGTYEETELGLDTFLADFN